MDRSAYSAYYLHKARLYEKFNEYHEYLTFLNSMRALNAEDQLEWFPNELDVNAFVPREPFSTPHRTSQSTRPLSLPDMPYPNEAISVQDYYNPPRFPTTQEFDKMSVLQYMRWFYYLRYNSAWSNEDDKHGVSFMDAWVRFATSRASTLVFFMLTSEYETYHFAQDFDDIKLLMLHRQPKNYELEFLKRSMNIELYTYVYIFLGEPIPISSPFTAPTPTFSGRRFQDSSTLTTRF